MRIFKSPLLGRKTIAKDTVEIAFGIADRDFRFQAGQYVRLTIPELDFPDLRGNYRDFSIISSPNECRVLKIAMRVSESGFKKTLMGMPVGREVQITGPHGELTLPNDTRHPIVYVAGGIGITPFMSHLQFAMEEKTAHEFIVLYSNISTESAAYLPELEAMARERPKLALHTIFSSIEEGHVREHIMRIMEITTPIWFLSGPPAMISAMRKLLLALGVAEENLHTEEFLGYEPGTSLPSQAVLRRLATTKDVLKLQMARAETLLDALSKIALISEDDIEGTITFANDKFVEISKYDREEIMGQNHRILKSGYHSTQFFKEMWATISSGRVWRGEVKNMAKDGTPYWVDSVIAPVMGPEGRPVSYLSVRFPITERKDLEELKAKDDAILASMGDGMAAVDEEGRIVFVSKSFERLLNLEAAEVIGKLFDEAVPAEDEDGKAIPKSERLINKVRSQRVGTDTAPITTEGRAFYYTRKGGTRFPVGITVSQIWTGKKYAGAVEIFRDITKEKSVDRAKTEFVSLASHQLRTPLTTVNWYSEMLLASRTKMPAERQKEYLEKIHANSQRMVSLVNTLLNVSRIDLGTLAVAPRPVDVNVLMREVFGEQAPQIEQKKLRLVSHLPGTLPILQTDPNLLRMVFQNLLSNAVKYTPSGGHIEIAAAHDGRELRIVFSDTGCGIPKKDHEKIFSKLFRADNVKEQGADGNGLGLYIVKSVLAALGGAVRFESEENKGTKFFVSLPLGATPATDSKASDR